MRDYDKEFQDTTLRQYAYDFDSVVRKYMMRTLAPFFPRGGKALEIGCFEGESTRLIGEHFDDLTVLEASGELIATARANVRDGIAFVHDTIETVEFGPRFDAIFLVHTLEHLDAPVDALARIGSWLTPGGRLFLVVPNAQAASRQIAVRMGLIETNNSVTEGERIHGHRCTYSLDTLEHEALQAGLQVTQRGGILFKPMANFQFDAALRAGIIDQPFFEGCYKMGMKYPDLTASVYVVCEA